MTDEGSTGPTAVRVVVRGQVTGVGFRWWAAREAERLGVRGWVRNAFDDVVEAHLEGDRASVLAMVDAMREGPRFAVVEDVRVRAVEPEGATGFSVER